MSHPRVVEGFGVAAGLCVSDSLVQSNKLVGGGIIVLFGMFEQVVHYHCQQGVPSPKFPTSETVSFVSFVRRIGCQCAPMSSSHAEGHPNRCGANILGNLLQTRVVSVVGGFVLVVSLLAIGFECSSLSNCFVCILSIFEDLVR